MKVSSCHFIPGDRPKLFTEKLPAEPSLIVIDLEDAVSPLKKEEARQNISRHLECRTDSAPLFVRVNQSETKEFDLDLRLLMKYPKVGVVLPKFETLRQLEKISSALPSNPIIPLVESFASLKNLPAMKFSENIVGLGLGLEDLLSECVQELDYRSAFVEHICTSFAVATRGHGLPAIGPVSLAIKDPIQLKEDCDRTFRQGFDGMQCIHPSQIAVLNKTFAVSDSLMQWAAEIVELADIQGYSGGYVRAGEVILSPPKLSRANRILKQRGN